MGGQELISWAFSGAEVYKLTTFWPEKLMKTPLRKQRKLNQENIAFCCSKTVQEWKKKKNQKRRIIYSHVCVKAHIQISVCDYAHMQIFFMSQGINFIYTLYIYIFLWTRCLQLWTSTTYTSEGMISDEFQRTSFSGKANYILFLQKREVGEDSERVVQAVYLQHLVDNQQVTQGTILKGKMNKGRQVKCVQQGLNKMTLQAQLPSYGTKISQNKRQIKWLHQKFHEDFKSKKKKKIPGIKQKWKHWHFQQNRKSKGQTWKMNRQNETQLFRNWSKNECFTC